jgi:antitoxin CptB
MTQSTNDRDPYKALRWRCRRGLKELDIMLERFLSAKFEGLTEQDKIDFSQLLEESDMDLLEWFTGKSIPQQAHYRSLIATITSLPA